MNKEQVILMILNQRFLPDIRVEQEYKSLRKAGYRVIVVADTNGKNSDEYEIIRVKPNAGLSSKYNLTLRKNPKLKKEIIKELNRIGVTKIDAIHVHDLFWSFIGFGLKKYFKAKLVIDLHENYPAMIRDFGAGLKKRSFKMYLSIIYQSMKRPVNGPIWDVFKEWAHQPKRLEKYEKQILEKCDRFIVVVDEALERFKNEEFYNKGIVVSNTKDPKHWEYDNLPALNEKVIITYLGGTESDLRGLETAIFAMKYVDQSHYHLDIVGVRSGRPMYRKYVKIIDENNIRNVNLVEWLEDENEAFKYINNAHLCIVPFKSTDLTQTTIPHKLFMYMSIGRPVLVSDVAPIKRIVEDSNCGLVFKAGDEKDLAQKLQMLRDEKLLGKMAINGRKAAEEKYNWKNDSRRLVEMYQNLLVY